MRIYQALLAALLTAGMAALGFGVACAEMGNFANWLMAGGAITMGIALKGIEVTDR